MSLPKFVRILEYELVFGKKSPQNRISIISEIGLNQVLYEIVALNYRLKPKDRHHFDLSLEKQKNELKYFARSKESFEKFASAASKLTLNRENYPIIFSRPFCVFAIEEILNSNELKTDDNYILVPEDYIRILTYLVSINSEIARIQNKRNQEEISLESLNPRMIPLNELLVETDTTFSYYRGYKLVQFLSSNPVIGQDFQEYFFELYGTEPIEYLNDILKILTWKSSNISYLNFHFEVNTEFSRIFEVLSNRLQNNDTIKLISTKKSPFYKVNSNSYILLDNTFLIDKLYYQIINDTWFDKIKKIKVGNKNKYNIKQYRSIFGQFFESYLDEIIRNSFSKMKDCKLLLFDDLKIRSDAGEIELSDFYLREGNRVILAEVKSSSIYDKEKFGGNLETFYRNNRDDFFKTFGLNQLISSIDKLQTEICSLDSEFPKDNSIIIFPCLILNDKVFKTPFMAEVFNIRFEELKKTITDKKLNIAKLQLIHVNDLELLEQYLIDNPQEIWNILEKNIENNTFIQPFMYNFIHLIDELKPPEKILSLIRESKPKK